MECQGPPFRENLSLWGDEVREMWGGLRRGPSREERRVPLRGGDLFYKEGERLIDAFKGA